MKKSVRIGQTVYSVKVNEDTITAEETTFPLSGYGNNFGTGYSIDLNYSKAWAKVEVYCWNNNWGCRGHGLTDSWTDSVGYIRKGDAKERKEKRVRSLFPR